MCEWGRPVVKWFLWVLDWLYPEGRFVPRRMFQVVGDSKPNRVDHVWLEDHVQFKCVLCGAVTQLPPPAYPTPTNWEPDGYEPLTAGDRLACPPKVGRGK